MKLLHIAIQELKAVFSNKGTLMVLGVGALLYAFFYPLPYLPQVARDLPVVVVDTDNSALSRQLTQMADATEQVAIVEIVRSEHEAEALLASGKALGVLTIPHGFERAILRGERSIVGIYGDASYFLAYSQIATGLASATGTLSAGIEIRKLQASGYTEAAAYDRRDPLPLQVMPLYNETSGYGHYVVPAVLILILQQTLLVGIGMLNGARREEEAPNNAPTSWRPSLRRAWSNTQILLGRTLAYILIYSVHIAIYLFVIYKVFDFPRRGGIGQIYLYLLPFLLSTIFLGMALSTLFRERETAIQILLFSSMPAIFISGFAWPPEGLPLWIQKASVLLPSTSAMDGYLRLNHLAADFYQVKDSWLTLWYLCAIYFLLALLCAAFGRTGEAKTEKQLPVSTPVSPSTPCSPPLLNDAPTSASS